jgi:hypothetical protein
MTIRRGEEWGTTVPRPTGLVTLDSDAALAAHVRAGTPAPCTLAGGDIHRSLGSPAVRDPVQLLPMDALEVELDGRRLLAVAHVVARRPGRLGWWRGPVLAVMNADHVGDWNVAPRAHPNDGRFDVVEVSPSMRLRDRWHARSRLSQGTHVPHPDITVRSADAADWAFDRPRLIVVDAVERGLATRLTVRVSPDRFAIHV